jgi:site-specific recombinase XerD
VEAKTCAGEAAQAEATYGRVELENTMATLMLEGGADIRYIQAMLGHKRLDTTL